MEQLVKDVVKWADDKGLLKKENSSKQFLKVAEEVGEVASALAKDKPDMLKDGIGDVFVTLIILAEQNGMTAEECLQAAYNEIKNRTGKTVNGVFVKQSDI
jgi:NTP pyrophosphatase (non-canonical NTP hydrolase)